ncbi:MAG: L,D-transpeptidase [Patescibacteria group bacterium]
MSGGRKLLVMGCMIMGVVLNAGFAVDAWVWAPTNNTDLDVKITNHHFSLRLVPHQLAIIKDEITNIDATIWNTQDVYFQNIFQGATQDYSIVPFCPQFGWSDPTGTLSWQTPVVDINFGQSFNFQLPITAPAEPGWYRLYLQPYVRQQPTNTPIIVDLQVGDQLPNTAPVLPEKRIEVSLDDQTVSLYAGRFKIVEFVASTGKVGEETPPGRYVINKKLVDVFSKSPINLWLPYWMELRDLDGIYEGYGIHGLPYKLPAEANYQEGKVYAGQYYYTNGKLYVNPKLLGRPMSQGCVVLSVADAQMVFDWVEPDKTLVNIK